MKNGCHGYGVFGSFAIVKEALFGPVRPQVPASILQLHPDVTVVLDEEAASYL